MLFFKHETRTQTNPQLHKKNQQSKATISPPLTLKRRLRLQQMTHFATSFCGVIVVFPVHTHLLFEKKTKV